MDNKKIFTIQINGISESIDGVTALNKQLNDLEKRIKALESSNVKVNATSKSGGGNASALSEEEAIQREINKLKAEGANLDAKIVAAQDEVYKKVDATKQLYNEVVADQKAMAAQERLIADEYSNTMQGMKQHLADLKAVINTTDLGDSESIKKMTSEANELTKKLKEMEEAYGQFGRNVGNYQDAANGFKGLAIQVGDITQKFDNAKQALKELKGEMRTLQVKKDFGLISDEEVKRLKDLIPIVAQLESSIQDAGKPMDAIMDTMQSIVAIAQSANGLSAFFGFDSDAIERSIQKLVALQNAMQGLQTIQKQLKSGEFMGGWLSKASSAMDAFAAKITKTDKAAKALSLTLKGLSGIALIGVIIAITKALSDLNKKQKDVEKATEEGIRAYAKAETEITLLQTKLNKFNGTKEQEKKLVESLNSKYGNSLGQYKSLAEWKDALVRKGKIYCQILQKEAEMQAIMNLYTENYIKLQKARKAQDEGNQDTVDLILKALDGEVSIRRVLASIRDDFKAPFTNDLHEYNDELEREVDELEKNGEKLNEKAEKIQTEISELSSKYEVMDNAPQIKKNGKKTVDAIKNVEHDIEKELIQLRINAMKEGLNKTITQLEEERKQRIAKLRENGKYYTDAEAEVNAIIDKMILDEKEKHAKDVEKVYKDMWDRINANSLENTRKLITKAEMAINIQKQNLEDNANEFFNQSIGSYGIQGKNQLSPTTQFSLGINSENQSQFMKEMKEYINLLREAQTAENEYNAMFHEFYNEFNGLSDEQRSQLNIDLDNQMQYFNELETKVEEYLSFLKEKYGEENVINTKTALDNESYSSDLATMFNQRISAIEAYWAKRKKIESENAENLYKDELREAEQAWKRESGATWDAYQEELSQANDFYTKKLELIDQNEKDGTLSVEEARLERKELEAEYQKTATQMYQNYVFADELLRSTHDSKVIELEQKKNNTLKQINSKYYQSILQELRDFQTAQYDLESKQPVKNAWGITNFNKTNENNRNLLASYEAMAKKIKEKRAQVNQDFKEGLIDKDVYDSTIRELDRFSSGLGEKMDEVKRKLSVTERIGQFISDINQYLQTLGQSIQTILSAVWDAEDAAFDKEQEEIDKANDALEKALDKQQEIVEQHKNAIDSIEDELATSRGDRRQHLIDQLNAEIEAQRAAQKEKERIERQQEAQQKRQEQLDKKRKEAEYKRNLASILVSGAMAAANGYATKPFIPTGLAMGALATTLTAVQYALAKQQKPYAKGGQLDGGVAQGKRHSEGGIPVLGGRASIEGGEFITNRQTTAKNVDLLEYINAKHRKLNIDDFIDFYSSGKVKKNIMSSSPRSKFADGGTIPTLSNTYTFDDRLIDAFEKYAERPSVVSVVDINSRQAAVKNVQVLAGISDK